MRSTDRLHAWSGNRCSEQAEQGSEHTEPPHRRQLLRRRNSHADTPSITIGGSA
ncbi:hypothetical protein CFBP6762_00793 [Xanthomonas arboricola pv. fragariae]|nr:hypothetical protein CFBP6762_00793 [Xanthomonas arboricola pv. fragariae]